MKQMIKNWKVIETLRDFIIFNKRKKQVEIGTNLNVDGNFLVNSIENIGKFKTTTEVSGVIETDGLPVIEDWVLLTGIEEGTTGFNLTETDFGYEDGSLVYNSMLFVIYLTLNGKSYAYQYESPVNLKGNIKKGKDFSKISSKLTFKELSLVSPFFTEEQYQAILSLIENK